MTKRKKDPPPPRPPPHREACTVCKGYGKIVINGRYIHCIVCDGKGYD